jgi:type I restriction enzyme M protein
VPPANASELLFLEHAIASMKEKAVVMVRLSVLQRSSNEAKIRTAIAYDGKIESVIALPKGIIPHWREDMALVILSHGNKDILFIDANQPYFSKRKGRRNTIYRVDHIIETAKNRTTDTYATLVPLSDVSAESLSPAYYFQKNRDLLNSKTLASVAGSIFRSQRLQSNTDSDTILYNEIGVKNIISNGYTLYSDIKKYGNMKRVDIFKLQTLDILLPLRGNASTVGIAGESKETLVCNSGLICIRPKDDTDAYALYLYLRSERGQEALDKLYDESPNRTINPEILATLAIPEIFDLKAKEKFENLGKIQKEITILEKEVHTIINS